MTGGLIMAGKKSSTLTDLELEIMNIFWDKGQVTAEEVRKGLPDERRLTDSSVRTMLRILEQKNYVFHTVDGRAFIYRPVSARENVAATIVRKVTDKVFRGSRLSHVKSLLGHEKLTKDELDEIKKMVAEQEK
jgi:predicted transcriptional regulator